MNHIETAVERGYRRIATEEAWATPELVQRYQKILLEKSVNDPGFFSLWGFFGTSDAPRANRPRRARGRSPRARARPACR